MSEVSQHPTFSTCRNGVDFDVIFGIFCVALGIDLDGSWCCEDMFETSGFYMSAWWALECSGDAPRIGEGETLCAGVAG